MTGVQTCALPISTVGIEKAKPSKGGGGKRNIDMKTMGRGLAKVAAQKRG